VLAAIAGSPLVQVFSLRQRGGHYQFYGFPAVPPHHPPHHERDAHLRACAAQFAANLESVVKRDPLQWYNFFPFWDEPATAQPPDENPKSNNFPSPDLPATLTPSEEERAGVSGLGSAAHPH